MSKALAVAGFFDDTACCRIEFLTCYAGFCSFYSGFLRIENYLNLENPRVYEAAVPAASNIEGYSMLFNARGMLKLLAALDVINGEDLTLLVDDKMVRVGSSNDFMVMAATLNAQNVQLKLKGEANGNRSNC